MKQIKPSKENNKLCAEVMKIQIKQKLYEKSAEKVLNELGIKVLK